MGVLGVRQGVARDVLLGVQRVATFAGDARGEWITEPSKKRLATVNKDVASLSDYETRLSDKIQLLLDALMAAESLVYVCAVLVPIAHGFAAIGTFVLSVMTASM